MVLHARLPQRPPVVEIVTAKEMDLRRLGALRESLENPALNRANGIAPTLGTAHVHPSVQDPQLKL